MAYKKQNFARGQTLYASQLNAMDGQIAANEAAIKENKRAIEALPSGGGTTLTGAQATTLGAGSAATAEIIDTVDGKVLKIGVPRGEKGDKGDTGPQGAQANVDTTLTVSGAAADAAAVGTRFGAVEGAQTVLEGRVTALEGGSIAVDNTLTQSGKAADAKAVGDAVQGLQAAHDNLVEQVGAIQPGLTQAEKSALLTLLGAAAYGSDDMAATYASLKALWEGGDVPVMAVNVTPTTLNMTMGGTAALKATVIPGTATDKTVSWSVSPTGIVNVNGGNVEAISVGECVITATAGGVSGTCTVSVQAAAIPATEITLDKNALELTEGDTTTLTATVTPVSSTDNVVWSVSPAGFATVTGGVVKALKAGNCTITATAGGKSATCAVTVKEASAPALLYELPNETTLVSSSKQSIDTGIKLFENAGTEPPVYTILLDMAVASDISYNVNLSPCIMHVYDEVGDKMGANLAIWGDGKVMLSYNGDSQKFAGISKPAEMFMRAKYAIQIDGLKIRSCKAGALGEWTTGTNALENIDETLLLGAGRGSDGGIIRYFDGTFYAAKVYSGLLSDTELNEFLQG